MRLTYTPGDETIRLLTEIAEKKGEAKAYFLDRLEPRSREENKIDSIHATLLLQNSELDRQKTADIIRKLSVRAPRDSVRDIRNTQHIYENLSAYNPYSQDSLKKVNQDLLRGIEGYKSTYRAGITHSYYWTGFIRMSLPSVEMREGMNELFHYLRYGKDPLLIKSCVCHYAIQFYEPFETNNEIISRFWQTLLLMEEHPFFEFLPWEKEILTAKKKYYSRLPGRDLNTNTTEFVNYMLETIDIALSGLLETCRRQVRPIDRIRYFYTLQLISFTRRDYMFVHKNISTSTASRDLNLGVETGFFIKQGTNNQTTYRCPQVFE
jgi:Fic family protein